MFHVKLARYGGQPVTETVRAATGEARGVYAAATGTLTLARDDTAIVSPEVVVFGADANGAWLENRCEVIACRINGVPVPPHGRHAVCHTDAITVGVAELVVEGVADAVAHVVPTGDATGAGRDDAPVRQAADCRDRAHAGAAAQLPVPSDEATWPDDFRDLIALAGPNVRVVRYHDHPSGEPALLDTLEERPVVDMADLPSGEDETDVLAALALEYREALMYGGQGRARKLKNIDVTARALLPADPFRDGPMKISPGTLLDDLLGPGRMQRVMAQLDAFGAGQLFAPVEQHEILALFAPRSLHGRRTPQAALLARQEHHVFSVDSCVPMLDARTAFPKETNA